MRVNSLLGAALSATGTEAGPCPAPELLAVYVENRATGSERAAVEEHLLRCDICTEQVIVASSLYGVPETLPSGGALADVLLTFLGHTVEILKGIGEIVPLPPPVPAAVRAGQTVLPNVARFARTFRDIRVEVTVERLAGRRAEIGLCAFRDGAAAERTRFSLLNNGRELASYPAHNGCVLFEPVRFGRYTIAIRRDRVNVGEISLILKEE